MAEKKELPFALLEILKDHSDENHILTAAQLKTMLEEQYGLSLERRTLYSNIDLLRQYGHDISDFHDNGKGYYLRKRQFDRAEVLMLCNAVHASHFICAKDSSVLIQKLLNTQSTAQRKEFSDRVYLPNPKKTENASLLENISRMADAIRDRRTVQFVYLHYSLKKELEPKRQEPYEVQPRYLVYQESRAYVIVTSEHHAGFGHYRLDRMQNVKILEKKFSALPKEMDAYQYAGNMYYMYGGETVHAVFRCENRILDQMMDECGKDCMVIPYDADRFDIHISGCREGLLILAQQYLDSAVIEEPEDLQKEMAARIRSAGRRCR